jgi:hypothetical protein
MWFDTHQYHRNIENGVRTLLSMVQDGAQTKLTLKADRVWPPGVSIDFLSISTINNVNGKASANANYTWYWAHVAVTWIFTLSIFFFFYRGYMAYVRLRQKFFTSHEYVNAVYSKSILIMNVPEECQNDSTLDSWAKHIGIRSHISEASIGHNSEELSKVVTEHEEAVKELEIYLSSYLGGKSYLYI